MKTLFASLAALLMLSLIVAVWSDRWVAWQDVGLRIADGRRADEWHRVVVLQCQPKPARWSPAAIRAQGVSHE